MNDIELEQQSTFYRTYEFKGTELHPFSEGRRATAMSIGVRLTGSPPPTLMDMHALIFICVCDLKALSKAHRDPDGFWVKVLEWADANVSPADYETEGNLVQRMIEDAFSSKAETIETEGELTKPLGN